MSTAPTENLYRGLLGVPVELRSPGEKEPESGQPLDPATAVGTTLYGYFARFDEWNEIDSWYEGRFLERVAFGAFAKTFKERQGKMRSQYDHGYDPYFGGSPLGPFEVLREEDFGPYYEVPLLDTDYNRDRLIPQLGGVTLDGRTLGSVLGASYRFRVVKEEWIDPQKPSAYNPAMLPERTIREVVCFEAGPVPFGADEGATSGVRSVSLTDRYLERQAARTGQAARAARHLAQIANGAALGTPDATPTEPHLALDGSHTRSSAAVQAFLATAFD